MVSEEFKENSQMVRNELGAIEITIFDTDAKMAADMANDIVHTVDNINKSFFAEQNQKGIRLMEDNIKTKTAQISHLNDTLAQLRRGSNQDLISTYAAQQKAAVKDLNKLNGLYEQYKAAAGNEFSTVNVIEPAYAAERKSKPVRWLIVVSIVLVSFCVSVIFLLLKERWASIKKELA
jgi:capsular polysaccharide biosynthesis protein